MLLCQGRRRRRRFHNLAAVDINSPTNKSSSLQLSHWASQFGSGRAFQRNSQLLHSTLFLATDLWHGNCYELLIMGDCTLTTNPMKEKVEQALTTSRMTRAIWGVKNQDNRPDKLSSMAMAASSIWTDKGCSLKLYLISWAHLAETTDLQKHLVDSRV